jgi:TRAP-type C4-dicarboxylate transport system substrate-binding protein
MPRRPLIALAVGLTGVLSVTCAHAQTKLTLNHYVGVNHPFVKTILGPWGQKVEEATQGRVRIEIPRAPLTPVQSAWSSVETGVADIAIIHDSFERQRLEMMQIAFLPGMGAASTKTAMALWDTYHKFLQKAGEYKGVKLLGLWAQPGTHVYSSKSHIKQVGDFAGLKFGANPGIGAAVVTALGASPVTTSGPPSFELVSRGVVDGVVFPTVATSLFKLNRYLKYETHFPGGLYSGTWSVIMNLGKWNSLSAADQKAIDGLTHGAILAVGGKYWDDRTVSAREDNTKAGVQTMQASPELTAAVMQKLAPITEDWIKRANAKGVDGKAALAHFREQIK